MGAGRRATRTEINWFMPSNMPPVSHSAKETRLTTMRQTVNAAMAALIDGHFGCLDAAAETINARWGANVSKGTLSKRLSGQLEWPITDVVALEDAAGVRPVTRMMVSRQTSRQVPVQDCIITRAGEASREAGEAIAWAIKAASSMDDGDAAKAHTEAVEARDALDALVRATAPGVTPIARKAS